MQKMHKAHHHDRASDVSKFSRFLSCLWQLLSMEITCTSNKLPHDDRRRLEVITDKRWCGELQLISKQ
jgi:hypothetical protein